MTTGARSAEATAAGSTAAGSTAARARAGKAAATSASTARVATPWGAAALVDELRVPQQAGEKRFASLVQLLETAKGERLVRFAYATDGVARRGPVTLRARDLGRLRAALEKHPELAEALRF